jgi:hypothetical protein
MSSQAIDIKMQLAAIGGHSLRHLLMESSAKGTAEYKRHSDPFCDPPNLGTPGLGNSASHPDNIGALDRFGCAINHTVRSNATFCDAQHIALNGVSVFS